MARQTYQKAIIAAMMDGKWRDFEDVFLQVRADIPADKADAEYRKRHPGWKGVAPRTRVEKGRRRLAILTLISLKYRGQVEGRGPSGSQLFRLPKDVIKARKKKEAGV